MQVPRINLPSPLFGDLPRVLIIIEVNLVAGAREVVAWLRRTIESHPLITRASLGFGPGYFHRANLPLPTRLRPLDFSFDVADSSPRDVLICFDSDPERLRASFDLVRTLVHSTSLANAMTHLGLRRESNRGNLGFIDGTSNLQDLTREEFASVVFVQPEDDPDYVGGSYLVLRKYKEEIKLWEGLSRDVQEQFVGRRKESGAFLNDKEHFTRDNWRVTPTVAHIRCAHARVNGERPFDWRERMYRRSIPYAVSTAEREPEHGLIFLAVVRDPVTQVEQLHNDKLLPRTAPRDLLLSSGYVTPIRTACYYFMPTV